MPPKIRQAAGGSRWICGQNPLGVYLLGIVLMLLVMRVAGTNTYAPRVFVAALIVLAIWVPVGIPVVWHGEVLKNMACAPAGT
jgi:hypothetical protein